MQYADVISYVLERIDDDFSKTILSNWCGMKIVAVFLSECDIAIG